MVIFEILRYLFLAPLELVFEVIFTIAFKITQNEGVAIIVLSLVVSTLVLPLYMRAERIEAEQRTRDHKLSKWAGHIKKHLKGDLRYMTLDAYYRENKYSPLSQLRSSISILLQIPFFAAAYDLLGVRAIDRFSGIRAFFNISLSEPDRLINIAGVSFNALPLLMTAINMLACYVYTKEHPLKTAIRSYALALVFLVLLYNAPSALLLYWTMNNIYSLVKTVIIKKRSNNKTVRRSLNVVASKVSGSSQKGISLISLSGMRINNGLFVLSAVFMSVLTGLLIPLAYLSASPEEFISISNPQNPLHYILPAFCVSVGFFVLWPSVFYCLANNKTKAIISVIMLAVSVISAVDYLFFGKETGIINTTLVFDRPPTFTVENRVLNTVLILVLAVICVCICRFRKTLYFILIAAIMAVLTISMINMNKIQDTYSSVTENFSSFKEDNAPKIQLSSECENVMVIMLDRAISGFVPYVFYEFPEIADKFDGFVYYPNTISFGQNTLKTTSALFGGYEYTPERMDVRNDVSLKEKHDEALRLLPVLFSEQGYSITLMDLPYPGWSWSGDYSSFKDIDNCFVYYVKDYYNSDDEENKNTDNRRNRNLFMYSIFRCSPLIFQEFIYDDGEYLSVGKDDFDVYNVLENYKVLENLDEMTRVNNEYNGTLLLLDNETTHDIANIYNFDPYTLSNFEGGYYISNGSNDLFIWDPIQSASYECLVAALRELGNYMDYLRENDLYDNTRIIIVSDHGNAMYLFDGLVSEDYSFSAEWFNPLFMVKDFNSTGYITDYSFMTNADVPTIAMEGIIDDPVNPATGNPVNSDLKNDDIYVGYSPNNDADWNLWNPENNPGSVFYYDDEYEWFKIENENIFCLDNWVCVDNPE